MFHEYALDPELLNNWHSFRYFISEFGLSKGRLISRYPKKWKMRVYEALKDCHPVEKKKIEEKLRGMDEKLYFQIRVHEWEPQLSWVCNAIEEHSKRPFRAIIVKVSPQENEQILIGDDLDETNPLWSATTQRKVKRTAAEMGACIKSLFQLGQEFVFVDPYFFGSGRNGKRHLRPLEEFLKIIITNRNPSQSVKRLEYHTCDRLNGVQFKGLCDSELPRIIPQGLTLNIIVWREGSFHNRYILTDLAGVTFGTGLDDDDQGNSTENDDVILLSQELSKEKWEEFKGKPVFHSVKGIKP